MEADFSDILISNRQLVFKATVAYQSCSCVFTPSPLTPLPHWARGPRDEECRPCSFSIGRNLMNSVSSQSVPSQVSMSRLLSRAAWVIVLCLTAFFLVTRVPRYLVLTEQSYGPYFWPRSNWVLPHVLGGLLAILIGPLQFWSRIRRDHIQVHRWSGRVYLAGVVVGESPVSDWQPPARLRSPTRQALRA